MMIESPFIINWRKKFLVTLAGYRRDGRPIYYLDESYYHQNSTRRRVWCDTTVVSAEDAAEKGLSTGLKIPSGKGQRCIIIGIGNENGWLKLDIWKRSAKKGPLLADYHAVYLPIFNPNYL